MREALRTGKELDLQKFTDIHPVHYRQFLDHYSVQAEKEKPAEVPEKKTGIYEKATLTLMGLGVDYREASALVLKAQEKLGMGAKAEQVAKQAYTELMSGPEMESIDSNDLRKNSGYEELVKNGVIETDVL